MIVLSFRIKTFVFGGDYMKWKRSERLVDMTQYLMEHPHKLIPLTYFASLYQSAKSSISEDLTIVKETFEERGRGLTYYRSRSSWRCKIYTDDDD